MFGRVFLFILLLFGSVVAFSQDAATTQSRKSPTDRMVLRSNTRDQIIMMQGNRHQHMYLHRRQENLQQNQMQLNRRMMIHRQNRMMQQNRQRDIQRQSMQRQMMQQRRGPRR